MRIAAGTYYPHHRLEQDPQEVPEKILKQLIVGRSEFKAEDFTLQDLLSVLPGPFRKTLPKAWEEKRDELELGAIGALNLKLEAAEKKGVPLEANEGPLHQALRAILDRKENPSGFLCDALDACAYLHDPKVTPRLLILMRAYDEEVVSHAATALGKSHDPAALDGVKKLWRDVLTTRVGEYDETKVFGKFHWEGLRPWGLALLDLCGSEKAWIACLDEIDQIPLAIEKIREFRLEQGKGEKLTGKGVSGVFFDSEFNAKHADIVDNFTAVNEDLGIHEHGTSVASVWFGKAGGVAPGTKVEGDNFFESYQAETMKVWTNRLQTAIDQAKAGKPHPRVFCTSMAPDLRRASPTQMAAYLIEEKKWFQTCLAAQKSGIVILIAAGNIEAWNKDVYDPAKGQLDSYECSPAILRVGAAVRQDHEGKVWKADSANVSGGTEYIPSFCAPTERLAASYTSFDIFNGSSCSAPFAAGVVCLMLQANPALTANDVFEILDKTCDPMLEGDPKKVGKGIINPTRAIEASLRKKDPKEADRFLAFMKL